MRIYGNIMEMVREVERDLWEMGIHNHPETMQDKVVGDNPDYDTKEIPAYGFQIVSPQPPAKEEEAFIRYLLPTEVVEVLLYIAAEFNDRISGNQMNPGNAWDKRPKVWTEFMHGGKFAYTYSDRMGPQVERIEKLLHDAPNTRQAIINIHSNIAPGWDSTASSVTGSNVTTARLSADAYNTGGSGRIPCSMYYQLLRRAGKMDLIYTMRSCDFLTHFPIDILLAIKLQRHMAAACQIPVGTFTYFTGSLHAYTKDMKTRGIF